MRVFWKSGYYVYYKMAYYSYLIKFVEWKDLILKKFFFKGLDKCGLFIWYESNNDLVEIVFKIII